MQSNELKLPQRELGPPRAKVAPRTDRIQTKSGRPGQFGPASPDLPHRAACPGAL
ncbi:hypothetical protein NEUTE1DRAFT_116850 [Neurospora tetrasperma FGSC 2508]|uniref:Uncharacterized protein n=1 Tax=Neurospora tetrasperma (strain FGSC 2508 / ATCC MYA-4615 / P0657) TaxID=510951 RepID=F8ML65_NEUT8|nr:uncharacterized protein NEUTE1DRAFT_116850 [Neurospora tetrasperma FGSC 2508]EGO57540.1 hypothetical protein NEUTE1DRAFT_116850 [Neurospora tetrasperma FGSC 2508]EGZ72201.1 hypothetical protein NEUTE2DRAFT_144757 [Neurospora tetrasperma FGSC 2509]